MNQPRRALAAAAGLLLLAIYQLRGASLVPFHPDESSTLFQSRDLEALFRAPGSLAWSPDRIVDPELSYRLLNAPLPKYVLGLGRWIAGVPAAEVATDWNWSEDWETNVANGALPSPGAIAAGRSASTLLLAPAALFLGLTGRRLGGTAVGASAAILFSLNALVLLHGRRAMAEATLLCALCLALWTLVEGAGRPWRIGVGTALALAAKHSAIALIPIGAIASLWPNSPHPTASRRLADLASFAGVLLVATLALNPVLWSDPIGATGQILQARRSLVQDQVQAQAVAEQLAIEVPLRGPDRLAVLVAHLFLAPPQFEEIGNYRAELAASVSGYLAIPGHDLFRGRVWGAIGLGLTLYGFVLGLLRVRRGPPPAVRPLALAALSTLALGATLYLGIPLPYQRYYLPLVPLTCLWSGYGLVSLAEQTRKLPVFRAASG